MKSDCNIYITRFNHNKGGKFSIMKMVGDGNCFFRSISYFVFGRQSEHSYVRYRVVRYILENWERFKYFMDCDKQEYLKSMVFDGGFGGQPEMVAVSEVFNCQLRICFDDSTNRKPEIIGKRRTKCFLLYSGPSDAGHYDVLKPMQSNWCSLTSHKYSLRKLREKTREQFRDDREFYKRIKKFRNDVLTQ